MVGVGGRSKACDNCRRRRVKCDLTTPECQKCLKTGQKCGGPRGLTVVLYRKSREESAASQSTGPSTQSGKDYIQAVSLTQTSAHKIAGLPASYDEAFISYTQLHLFRGFSPTSATEPKENRLLAGNAVLALSTAYFGLSHDNYSIVQRGLQRYGGMLGKLNRTLGDASRCQSTDVLETLVTLLWFEFLISDSQDGWITHSRGLERLFAMRGPESTASPTCLEILQRSRLMVIFAAVVLHQSTILATPQWKTIPWLLHMIPKDSMQSLIDIIADCPELFVLRDAISAGPDMEPPALRKLLEKAHQVLGSLREWEQFWGPIPPASCVEVASPPTTPTLTDAKGRVQPLWSKVLSYASIYDANVTTLYYGTLILVLNFIRNLMLNFDFQQDFTAFDQDLTFAAWNICRSVDFLLGPMSDDVGIFSTLFPLRMVFEAVKNTDPAIADWVEAILAGMASRSAGRWATARYVLGIGASSDKAISCADIMP